MKKFIFSMDRLLNYKDQIKGSERNILSGLVSEKNLLEKKIKNLENELKSLYDILTEKTRNGTTGLEISKFRFNIQNYKQQIDYYKEQCIIANRKIDIQRQEVIKISQEVSSLENLKDKKKDEYIEYENKQQNIFIEEYITQKMFRAR
ncbi:MAG: flagellar FliJ family protein [Oscillospiraceae bacterium]